MSAQICAERNAYYEALGAAQKGDLDVTAWLLWFLGCLERAIAGAEATLEAVNRKARFWMSLADPPVNGRQRQMLNRLLDGFTGKLTSSKRAAMTKVSQDTALRDIDDLVRRGVLRNAPGGGRSTSYALTFD